MEEIIETLVVELFVLKGVIHEFKFAKGLEEYLKIPRYFTIGEYLCDYFKSVCFVFDYVCDFWGVHLQIVNEIRDVGEVVYFVCDII